MAITTAGNLFEPTPPWAHQVTTAQPTISSLPVTQPDDILVRKVNNGWLVTKVNQYGAKHDVYVASDIDALSDVFRLAAVSGVIAKAK